MTAMHHPLAREYWKRDPEFDTIEVSNTGRVRTASTKAPVPIIGSGGKAHVHVTDKSGRRHDRNVRRLVRKLFGIAPIRIAPTGEKAPQPPITIKTTGTETSVNVVQQFAESMKEALVGAESSDAGRAAAPQPPTVADDIVPLVWPGAQDGYTISRFGEVFSPKIGQMDGTVIRSRVGNYRVVNLPRVPGSGFNGYLQVRMDELVATHFIGPKPEGDYVAKHLNGNSMDNRAENLQWAPRVRQVFRPTKFTARGTKVNSRSERQKRLREMAADPNWRQVTNSKIVQGQYWISRDGVARGQMGRDLTTFIYEDGHVGVYMKSSETNNATTIRVDQLVLEAFGEERPTPRHRVIHRNGIITDCRAENLYWGSSRKTVDPEPVDPPKPVEEPTPVEEPVITPTKATVKVTTLASYRIGDVEVIVNNGIIEPPTGGTAVEQAAALAQIYAEIAKGQG